MAKLWQAPLSSIRYAPAGVTDENSAKNVAMLQNEPTDCS